MQQQAWHQKGLCGHCVNIMSLSKFTVTSQSLAGEPAAYLACGLPGGAAHECSRQLAFCYEQLHMHGLELAFPKPELRSLLQGLAQLSLCFAGCPEDFGTGLAQVLKCLLKPVFW